MIRKKASQRNDAFKAKQLNTFRMDWHQMDKNAIEYFVYEIYFYASR